MANSKLPHWRMMSWVWYRSTYQENVITLSRGNWITPPFLFPSYATNIRCKQLFTKCNETMVDELEEQFPFWKATEDSFLTFKRRIIHMQTPPWLVSLGILSHSCCPSSLHKHACLPKCNTHTLAMTFSIRLQTNIQKYQRGHAWRAFN